MAAPGRRTGRDLRRKNHTAVLRRLRFGGPMNRARNRGEDVPGFDRGGQMIQQERAREPSAFMRDRITKEGSS